MALFATNRFAGDGTTTQYEINFVGQYIDRSHVKAYRVDDATQVRTPVTITPGQWLNATTITGFAPTPVGQTMVIYRDTPKAPMVDFINGSRFTEHNMDLVARQGLFAAMEALDAGGSEARQQLLDAIAVVVDLVDDATAAVSDATAAALAAATSAANAADAATLAQSALADAVTKDQFSHATVTFPTKAAAEAALPTIIEGQRIEIDADESLDGQRVWYTVQSAALVFVDLVPDVVAVPDYTKLLSYTGSASVIDVIGVIGSASPPGIEGRFVKTNRAGATTNGGTTFVLPNGDVFEREFVGPVIDKWFGVKGDKTTDDRAALQAAINYCLSFPLAKELRVTGMCRVSGSLNIDRLVDTTTSEFHITGVGTSSGFYVDTAITVFDSTLPMLGLAPQSEFVTFNNVRFEASVTGANANTLSSKFLRMKFNGCYWSGMRLMDDGTAYVQSFYFHGCNMRRWPGIWLNASHALDTHFNQCISEHGTGWLTRFPNGAYSLTFRDGVHEGSGGGIVQGGGFRQLVVDGYYTEQNASHAMNLTQGPTNYGVTFTNNILMVTPTNEANADFWDVVWGPTVGARAGGNHSINGRIHDNSMMASMNAVLFGADQDTSSTTVVKAPLDADGVTTQVESLITSTLGHGTCNYALATRQGEQLHVDYSFTFPVSTSGSPAALTLPKQGSLPHFGGTIHFSDYTTTGIFAAGGSAHPAALGPGLLVMCSDLAGTTISYNEMSGRTVSGKITYQV